MKLVRYYDDEAIKPAAIDSSGHLRDLSGIVKDISGEVLSPAGIENLKKINLETLPAVSDNVRYATCVGGTQKIVCVGLSYRTHADELKMKTPEEPIIFLKAPSAICGAYDDLVLPPGSTHTDWESELLIVIGSKTKQIKETEAHDHIAGYSIVNDVSERHSQLERGGQWTKGKSYDTFASIGPWLVTKDEVLDPENLDISTKVNGEVKQQSNTSDMIFSLDYIVSYISFFMTLLPGDVICTGTPDGVAHGTSNRYLEEGDIVETTIQSLGQQKRKVVLQI